MKRFKTVDLSGQGHGLRPRSRKSGGLWGEVMDQVADKAPWNLKSSWGVPFEVGLVELSGARPRVRIPMKGKTNYLCILHFCDVPPSGEQLTGVGDLLAHYVLAYADGTEHRQSIRKRFEVMSFQQVWGNHPFSAAPHDMSRPATYEDSPTRGWGWVQTGITRGPDASPVVFWHYALENPHPEKSVVAFEAALTGPEPLAIVGVTMTRTTGHPLRQLARRHLLLGLPAGRACEVKDLSVEVDMGHITGLEAVPAWDPEEWLKSESAGLGEPQPRKPTRKFVIEISAAKDAELTVKASGTGKKRLSYAEALDRGKSVSGQVRIEPAHTGKAWVHVTVMDGSTGRPTPTRIHFRGSHGEYLAPYGHHTEVNTRWFEDYAGDLKLGNMSYAYVPGRFQILLPAGEVYVEASKGFEYEPLRKRVMIRPGERELTLTLDRGIDRRKDGWVTADTHVHFISPQTAWLEGQAEGLNLINLLASQWGKMFTNVADITGKLSGVSEDDTLVWVGTENRHHLLGHLSMLGTSGEPVYPMCMGGPAEAYFGDADMMTLTDWARTCREREGVVIRPHFPAPICEEPVYFLNELLDGVEFRPLLNVKEGLDSFRFREYYRYLNCGMRVAAVGGTDKMSAAMAVGAARTYARLDRNEPFTFANWGKAIRAGRAFTTSGPLIDIEVEGKTMGEELNLPVGGGTVEVRARAECVWPMHRLEVVMNGGVVAETQSSKGARRLSLRTRVKVDGSSWLAARCGSLPQDWQRWFNHPGAHSSPVYVQVGRRRQFSMTDASYMLTLIDGGLAYLDTLSVRFDEKRHRAMKAMFEDARRRIKQAMKERPDTQGQAHQHPHPHR